MEFNLDNPIAERKTKTVYKDGDKTIKLFVENYSKADILNEALNQARVEEGTDLNVPSLIAVTKINNRWALVSEHIEGTPLNKLIEEHPEKEDEYLNLFVDVQMNILNHKVPLLTTIKDKFRRKLNSATNIEENTKYELLQRLEGMKNHVKLCHGDFNPSNVIIKEDGTAWVIDWAHVTQGNASADASITYLLFLLEGEDKLADLYIKSFAKHFDIPLQYIQHWVSVVSATKLATTKDEKKRELLLRNINVVDAF